MLNSVISQIFLFTCWLIIRHKKITTKMATFTAHQWSRDKLKTSPCLIVDNVFDSFSCWKDGNTQLLIIYYVLTHRDGRK
jgi:hypothetical protein